RSLGRAYPFGEIPASLMSVGRVGTEPRVEMLKLTLRLIVVVAALAVAPAALADGWLPHTSDATWTYQWTDSVYNTTPTNEKVTVKDTKGNAFQLAWTTADQQNSADAPTSVGVVYLSDSASGIQNVDPGWQSNAPPSSFPILCAQLSQCGNSL